MGVRRSRQVFEHNNPDSLEAVLRNAIAQGQPRSGRAWKKVLIVTEGIFSMEGEACELAGIVAVAKKYKVGIIRHQDCAQQHSGSPHPHIPSFVSLCARHNTRRAFKPSV